MAAVTKYLNIVLENGFFNILSRVAKIFLTYGRTSKAQNISQHSNV